MFIRKPLQVKSCLLAVMIICMLMSGCAQNKQVNLDNSRANEFSAYLFSAGTVLYYGNNYSQAEELFRLASMYDPYSVTIRKSVFHTLQMRLETNEIPISYFTGYVDTLLTMKVMDKLMLEETYNVYARYGEYQKAKTLLDMYLTTYKSARAYTSLFYLEQMLYNKSRIKLLDKAFKLAGNDVSFLNSLGYLYQAIDSTKAESIWQTARRYDTTNQSAILLWNSYAHRNNKTKLKQLYNSFSLPDDREKLLEVMSRALGDDNHQSIILLRDEIITSNEPEVIFILLQASWLAKDNALFAQCWSVLQDMKLEKLSRQLEIFYGANYFLTTNQQAKALECVAQLDGKEALDQFVGIYRGTSLENTTEKDSETFDKLVGQLRSLFTAATDEQLAPPVKKYLLTVTDSLQYDNAIGASDSLTFPMVDWFYQNNRRTYDTYYWLALYYFRTKQDAPQKAILREALGEFPEDAALLNWLGYSYVLSEENLEEAEVLIRRALQLSPDSPYYLDSLGWLYYLKGDYKRAASYMEIPSRLEQMPSEIAYHLGAIYLAVNDNEAAKKFLKLALEINDDPEVVKKAQTLIDTLP